MLGIKAVSSGKKNNNNNFNSLNSLIQHIFTEKNDDGFSTYFSQLSLYI